MTGAYAPVLRSPRLSGKRLNAQAFFSCLSRAWISASLSGGELLTNEAMKLREREVIYRRERGESALAEAKVDALHIGIIVAHGADMLTKFLCKQNGNSVSDL